MPPSVDPYACAPVLVTLHGRTHRLPGPLALVQTDASLGGGQEITHVNGLSMEDVAASCPVAGGGEGGAAAAGGLLTSVRRGCVTVRALTVVAVHAALLGGDGCATGKGGEPDGGGAAAAAGEQRALLRAAARLTWGLAGVVYELMHRQAGHWPALADAESRQAVAGAALCQLYGLNRNLALAVLRAHGQLTPGRFDEMLQHGLLPTPARPAAAAGQGEEACVPAGAAAPACGPEEAAAPV